MKKRTVLLGALVAAVLLGGAPLRAQTTEDEEAGMGEPAEAALRRAASRYDAVDGYRGAFTVTERVVMADGERSMEIRIELAWERPNRLKATFEARGLELHVYSDADACRVYMPATNKFLIQPAVASVAEALSRQPLGVVVRGDLRRLTLAPFEADAYATLTAGVRSARVVGPEPVGETPAERLLLKTEDADLHLWVASEDGALLQARLDPWRAVERIQEIHPELESVSVEVAHEVGTIGGPLPEGTFAFKAPPGAAEAEDFEDLMTLTLEGKPAPDFTLPGLEEGQQWRLADFQGRIVMLDFWASRCGPCRMEMPVVQRVYDDYAENGVQLIAVNVGETREDVAAFLNAQRLSVPVALDADEQAATAYGASGIPRLVLIGKDGFVQAVHAGYWPGLEQKLREQLDTLLAGDSLAGE
jgi:thiol-disulfide isomerase/thioredoxin